MPYEVRLTMRNPQTYDVIQHEVLGHFDREKDAYDKYTETFNEYVDSQKGVHPVVTDFANGTIKIYEDDDSTQPFLLIHIQKIVVDM